jgi:hypothetical protein
MSSARRACTAINHLRRPPAGAAHTHTSGMTTAAVMLRQFEGRAAVCYSFAVSGSLTLDGAPRRCLDKTVLHQPSASASRY